jgi:hypothetical protein
MASFEEIMGMSDEELMGMDDIGDEDIGAIVRARRAVARRAAKPGPMLRRGQAGAQPFTRKRTTLGIPKASFANNAAAGTTVTVEVEPQRAFQPERFLAVAVSPVPSAKVGVRQITIGDVPQLPAAQAVPLEMFRADAVGVQLDLTECEPGTKLQVQYEVLTALGAAEGGDIVGGFAGEVIGQ